MTTNVTGVDAIFQSQGEAGGPSVLIEMLLGGIGALLILLFVFGTLPAVLMPLVVAVSSILTTFLCVLGLTYITDVSIVVQFLVALVGLGIAIDYSLLMIFRFREEMDQGLCGRRRDRRDDAARRAVGDRLGHDRRDRPRQHAADPAAVHPLDRDRGLLIPLVCVLASITLTPALLRMLGPKINR